MIFASETDECSLHAFKDEIAAARYFGGMDVRGGTWLFWDDGGRPIRPLCGSGAEGEAGIERGFLPAGGRRRGLADSLPEIIHFMASAPFDSRLGVRKHILRGKHGAGRTRMAWGGLLRTFRDWLPRRGGRAAEALKPGSVKRTGDF